MLNVPIYMALLGHDDQFQAFPLKVYLFQGRMDRAPPLPNQGPRPKYTGTRRILLLYDAIRVLDSCRRKRRSCRICINNFISHRQHPHFVGGRGARGAKFGIVRQCLRTGTTSRARTVKRMGNVSPLDNFAWGRGVPCRTSLPPRTSLRIPRF